MTVQNVPSDLLSEADNAKLFALLGCKCQTLASAVVQVYLAEPPTVNKWNKRCCGVATFIKDNPNRSYFIRVYDIRGGRLVWEQELYKSFVYKTPRRYFHTFDTDYCQAGLNFSSEDEASAFGDAVSCKLREREQRLAERQRLKQEQLQLVKEEEQQQHSQEQQQQVAVNHIVTASKVQGHKNEKKAKKQKGKLNRKDIGTPTGFTHVTHYGYDPQQGYVKKDLDPDLKNLFDAVGITEDMMKDVDISRSIHELIEMEGGEEAVKEAVKSITRPLPPTPRDSPPQVQRRNCPVPKDRDFPPPARPLPNVPSTPNQAKKSPSAEETLKLESSQSHGVPQRQGHHAEPETKRPQMPRMSRSPPPIPKTQEPETQTSLHPAVLQTPPFGQPQKAKPAVPSVPKPQIPQGLPQGIPSAQTPRQPAEISRQPKKVPPAVPAAPKPPFPNQQPNKEKKIPPSVPTAPKPQVPRLPNQQSSPAVPSVPKQSPQQLSQSEKALPVVPSTPKPRIPQPLSQSQRTPPQVPSAPKPRIPPTSLPPAVPSVPSLPPQPTQTEEASDEDVFPAPPDDLLTPEVDMLPTPPICNFPPAPVFVPLAPSLPTEKETAVQTTPSRREEKPKLKHDTGSERGAVLDDIVNFNKRILKPSSERVQSEPKVPPKDAGGRSIIDALVDHMIKIRPAMYSPDDDDEWT